MKVRKLVSGPVVAVLAATAAAVPGAMASSALAAPAQPASGSGAGQNLSAVASSSWQTNDIVWALKAVNGVVYAGGQFTSVRPPGDPKGTGEIGQAYLAAFSASTGALMSAFNPTFDGKVTALAVSPDGSTLYVGGSFTHVNGGYHPYAVALNIPSDTVDKSWAPVVSGPVLSIAPSPDGSEIYLGGDFAAWTGPAGTASARSPPRPERSSPGRRR